MPKFFSTKKTNDSEMLLFSTAPQDILNDVAPDEVPLPQPPDGSGYREADLDGVACAFCEKFSYRTSEPDEDGNLLPVGVCTLWEANVRGDHVSNGFADGGPPLDSNGNEVWDFADDTHQMQEIHFAAAGEAKRDGKIIKKRILRTGVWDTTPTGLGKLKKTLSIVRDGKSDPVKGVIALSELKENFDKQAIQNVMIPLSEVPQDDHLLTQNMTKLNTGFVRDLEIEEENGVNYLVASMEFTEPEVAEKVLRGTYADVSAGIPFKVKSRGKEFGAALHHVCITNTPFIDGLGPFMAASDATPEKINVTHTVLASEITEDPEAPIDSEEGTSNENEDGVAEAGAGDAPVQTPAPSLSETLALAQGALVSQLNLTDAYVAHDVQGDQIVVRNKIADDTWKVSYSLAEGAITLAPVHEWEVIHAEEPDAESPSLVAASAAPRSVFDKNRLEVAQAMRALRAPQNIQATKEAIDMALTREDLEALNLSDEQRAAFQSILDENADLSKKSRTSEADARIEDLKGKGFDKKPGFLKFYRDVMLSDDSGPALVLLSDDGSKERLTALEILDKAIDSMTVDGDVLFSDQHTDPGHNDPPPAADGEERPLEERLAEAKAALGR